MRFHRPLLFNRRVSRGVLEFEPHENFGLVEFYGLWNWSVSFWLWGRECPGGTCESAGGELVDRWADAYE